MSNLAAAFKEFDEAIKRQAHRARAEAVSRRLEQSLKRAFRAQGTKVIQAMRKHIRGHFAEGFDGHAAFLETPLKETVSENDWLGAWIEAEQATAKLFSEPIDAAVAKALQTVALAMIGDIGMDISFSLDNPRAVRYLDQYGANLVKGLGVTTESDLRGLISQATDDGWSWKQLEGAIGTQFSDYVNGDRSHLIAVTEVGEAYSEGNYIVGKDLQDAGLDMEKSWDPAGDGCPEICAPNAEQGWIPLDEQFQSGHDRPLGHPGCWCDMFIRRVGSNEE